MDVEHGKTWIEIDGLQLIAMKKLDLSLAGTAAKLADVAVTLEAAPAQAARIAELEAELEQTNKMIVGQIRADTAWGRLERAEQWEMRLAANEQARRGAEEDSDGR